MGNYNPSAPVILGQEWVPIRDEDIQFSPLVNTREVGTKFTTTSPQIVSQGRYYVDLPPSYSGSAENMTINVYPAGLEAATGPIKRLLIPVSSGGITGTGTSVQGSNTVAEALYDRSDAGAVLCTAANGNQYMALQFDMDRYAQALTGKRILGVNVLYQSTWFMLNGAAVPPLNNFTGLLAISTNLSVPANSFGLIDGDQVPLGPVSEGSGNRGTLRRIRLGEVNPFKSGTAFGERPPWQYPELARFSTTAASKLYVIFLFFNNATIPANVSYQVEYVNLEVLYCEEQRVLVGGFWANAFGTAPFGNGAQQVRMRDIATMSVNPTLPAGAYTMTISSADGGLYNSLIGDGSATDAAELNALREYYGISPHPGTEIAIPWPPEDHVGDTWTKSTTHILPQLSLHVSGGGTVTATHSYGRQAAAPVYGSVTALQTIIDDPAGAATSYPQVRFYARRFGATTVPLTIDSTTITGAGTSASITPTAFDALPEIIDGWREVTLRFATPPVMGLLSPEPVWRWSAAGELAANQWQILGAQAPAISGAAGINVLQVPTIDQLGPATYGAPTSGSTVALTWQSPLISGTALDANADAVLLFSQDPPTVTGVAVTQLSQVVTGIGLNCGGSPCNIPTGIGYHRVTWSSVAAAMQTTGFGSYALERFDVVDNTWRQIMSASSIAVTGFNDYEARIGIESRYRLRVLNLYRFAGAYSAEVFNTLSSPGVSGCTVDSSVLVFTTNEVQAGTSNLAYTMDFDQAPLEPIAFPEVETQVFQRMYGRDYQTAFRGTERGGEKFSRMVLVQNGAVSPTLLDRAFTSLRDLAWASLSYVCVRTETGDRWFANVAVPTGNIRRKTDGTSLHYASIDVTEATITPTTPSG